MTASEFGSVMAYIAAGIGKPLAAESTRVYFDLLGDLPLEVLQIAAKRVILEHRWASFPTVAELRDAAAETMQGRLSELTAGEAWGLAWRAVGEIDPEVDGSAERATRHLPPIVVEAIRAFGLVQLCYAKPDFARPQFIKIFDTIAARQKRFALMPPQVHQALTWRRQAIGRNVAGLLGNIGKPVTPDAKDDASKHEPAF